jgi:hypothetical protein
MEAVEATGVLHERALPRDRHREEQGVEPTVVEAFPNVATRCEHEPLFVAPLLRTHRAKRTVFLRRHASLEDDHVADVASQLRSEVLEVVASFGQQDRRPASLDRFQDVVEDHLVSPRG